jgi:hypothetical protein
MLCLPDHSSLQQPSTELCVEQRYRVHPHNASADDNAKRTAKTPCNDSTNTAADINSDGKVDATANVAANAASNTAADTPPNTAANGATYTGADRLADTWPHLRSQPKADVRTDADSYCEEPMQGLRQRMLCLPNDAVLPEPGPKLRLGPCHGMQGEHTNADLCPYGRVDARADRYPNAKTTADR